MLNFINIVEKTTTKTLKIFGGITAIWLLLIGFTSQTFIDFLNRGTYRHVYQGVPTGNLAMDDARWMAATRLKQVHRSGLALRLNGTEYAIRGDMIEFSKNPNIWAAEWKANGSAAGIAPHPNSVLYNYGKLQNEIALIAQAVEKPAKNIRIEINGTVVKILTDTGPGLALNQAKALDMVGQSLDKLELEPVSLEPELVEPTVTYESAVLAKQQALQILSDEILLKDGDKVYKISPEEIGTWIKAEPDGAKLKVTVDSLLVSEAIAKLAQEINVESVPASMKIVDSKVKSFSLPKNGRVLEEEVTVGNILGILAQRTSGASVTNELPLTFRVDIAGQDIDSPGELGIVELIGTATTTFKSSPRNRRSNIKNGAKFLTGVIVKPGEEFSTVKAVGRIGNASGYLPELVIRGNRTVPEYGGGLCQVSTTLFRAVMDAGLPITERRNHSFSVNYYETDGDGNYIGPGLDATIYTPQPDFKFVNDMKTSVLVWGTVKGDKITFDLYGTMDGRKSEIIGPVRHSDLPSGKPIYVETDTLAKGVTRLIEKPHRGASTTAYYTITYADGREIDHVFESFYRPWPARYLIGAEKKEAIEPTAAATGTAASSARAAVAKNIDAN